jgi:hypothetical protein
VENDRNLPSEKLEPVDLLCAEGVREGDPAGKDEDVMSKGCEQDD